MKLNIIELEHISKNTKKLICGTAQFILSFLQIKKNLNIIITNENHIRKINYRYRGLNKPTDVLAFVYDDEDLLGEIFLCLEPNKKKARAEGEKPLDRLKMIIIHGFLHLIGYDHKTARDNALMEEKTKYLLNQLLMTKK